MDLSRRSLLFAGATAFGGLALTGRAWATEPAQVRGVAVESAGQGARLTVSLDRPSPFRTFFLVGPDRFVIDIANSRLTTGTASAGAAGVVRGYRVGARPDGVSRIVVDLAAPAVLARQALGARSAPEISFDLTPVAAAAPPQRPVEYQGRSAPRRTIVVDAGHGGRDPGALGTTGVREKDVVLDAALQLRAALEGRGGRYQVALTRDADRFVPLEERVRFARSQNADLFISIHADSSPRAEAQGASVYTLSERGADRAQTIMASQNWDVDLGASAPRDAAVGNILVDLAQRETTNRSAQFAQTLIPRLGEVSPLLSNTHRNAGFFVLLAPDVPAVLIETGFLSNATDERRLADPRARQSMAAAMAQSIDAYFSGPQLYAARA